MYKVSSARWRHAVFAALLALLLIRASPDAQAKNQLLLLDRGHLDTVAARAQQGDAVLKAALETLRGEAEKLLQVAPSSVMDKGVVPPSGDKHDYMSQAPYWWPDPSKPNGLPYIRRDGERNPEINRISDHDHLGSLAASVSRLGLGYRLTGDERYAAHAARLVRAWFLDEPTRMNPHLRFGQGIPGITEGRGIGIIETRGLPDLLDGVLMLGGSAAWRQADDDGLQAWMKAFLTWLTDSSHGREEAKNGNNHETWYDVQVASLAIYTGNRGLARRTLEGSRARIARHFEPDGRQPRELERTRSWDYSLFNLEAFFHLAHLGERVGVNLWQHRTRDGRSLRAGLDFLVPFADGTKPWTLPQITPFRASALYVLLRKAAVVWKAPAYRTLADKVGGGTAREHLVIW